MPWKLGDKIIREGRSWSNDGVTHPTNWAIWSDSDKTAAGLTWEDPPAPYDNRFYWDASTPKALDDVNAVDEDGNNLLDEDGNQVINYGLKTQAKEQAKRKANSLISRFNWLVERSIYDSSKAIPSAVSTYVASIRTDCGDIETAIDGASNLNEFKALYQDTYNDDGTVDTVARINRWTDDDTVKTYIR